MKFKTQQANDSYLEMIEDVSKVAADMYRNILDIKVTDLERLQAHLAIEGFRQEGLSKAILTASTVEIGILGLQGGLVIASFNAEKE